MTTPFAAGQILTAAALDAVVPQVSFTAADQLINSTSAAAVTGLSFPVTAGTYAFDGVIVWTQGPAQAKQALQITGPSASFCRTTLREIELSGTGESVFINSVAALNTDLFAETTGQLSGVSVLWDFDGIVTFTAAGTLIIKVRCGVSNADTFTVRAGSKLILIEG